MTALKGGAVHSVPGTEQNTRSVRLYRASPSYMTRSDAAQTGLDPYNDFSGIASCRHPSLPGSGEFHTIFSKWGSASADKHYLWCVVESGGSHYLEFRFQDANNDFYSAVSAAISPVANEWSRYAFAIEDPGGASGTPYNVYFWEDGTLLGGAPVTVGDIQYQLLDTGTAAFQIGGTAAGADYFDGWIDDVHFWGQGNVLSTTSVQAWLATQATGNEGMAAYWPMNATYGTDLSPNGNDLSSVNVSPAVHSPYASFSHIVTEPDDWDAMPEGESYAGKLGGLVYTAKIVVVTDMQLITATVIDPVTVDLIFNQPPKVNDDILEVDNFRIVGITAGSVDREVLSISQESTTKLRLTIEEMKDSVVYEVRVANLVDLTDLNLYEGTNRTWKQFSGVGQAPTVTKVSPSTPASRTANIVLEVTDAHSGINVNRLWVTVEGAMAFQAGVFQSPYAGPGSRMENITDGYRITIDPEIDFDYGQVVDIVVNAEDQAGNVAT